MIDAAAYPAPEPDRRIRRPPVRGSNVREPRAETLMRRLRRCALTLVPWFLFPCGAIACSCSWMHAEATDGGTRVLSRDQWLSEVDPARYLEWGDAVFLGRVVSSKQLSEPGRSPNSPTVPLPQSLAVFEIERVWKGEAMTSVSVFTGSLGGGCGFKFTEGNQYVVFAESVPAFEPDWLRDIPGALYTSICNLTAEADQVREWLSILDEATEVWRPYWSQEEE